MGLKYKKHTLESILKEVKKFAEEKGRPPTSLECRDGLKGDDKVFSFGGRTLARHFGTFNNMLETAGLPTNTSPRPPVEVECAQCDKKFNKHVNQIEKSNNNFCSQSCAALFNNRKRPRRGKAKECKWCHNTFYPWDRQKGKEDTGSLCKDCRKKYNAGCRLVDGQILDYRNMTLKQFKDLPSVRRNTLQAVHIRIRQFGKSWNKHLLDLYDSCPNCKYSKHLELAHIINVGDFPDNTKLKVVHAETNIVPLCPNCHWELDYGDLELEHFQANLKHTITKPLVGIEPTSFA